MRQELVQDIFIRSVFGKRRSMISSTDIINVIDNTRASEERTSDISSLPELVKIIHKEQDSISAFCLNQVRCDCFL